MSLKENFNMNINPLNIEQNSNSNKKNLKKTKTEIKAISANNESNSKTKLTDDVLNKINSFDLTKINNAIKIAEILSKECGNDLENCYLMKKKDLLLHHKSQRAIINAIFRLSQKIK